MSTPKELQYLDKLIRYRVSEELNPDSGAAEPKMPTYAHWELPLGKFAQDNDLKPDEARLLLIGLAHNIQPDLFQVAIENTLKNGGEFPKIGGANGKNFRGFLPTGDTVLFLLAGSEWTERLKIQKLFSAEHPFAVRKILWLEDVPQGEPTMSGKIILAQEYVEIFIHGAAAPPHFGMSFPAKRITTELDWDHLVVNEQLRKQIDDLLDWRKYHEILLEKGAMDGRFRNGYRALFYGPPGTGKTFTATLLGNAMDREVYRIDLSMIVSKYIGETEKNLEILFARAEDKKWILFFDEADALFSKRTIVQHAHDKYANQEVSYLLQRIEDYNGLVILATNMKSNIDEAFIRRFNSILHFPIPDADERKLIWEKTFLPFTTFKMELPEDEVQAGKESPDIIELVKKYQLSGGSILNIVHYASIKGAKHMSLADENAAGDESAPAEKKGGSKSEKKKQKGLTIYLDDVIKGIKLELSKDNIPFR